MSSSTPNTRTRPVRCGWCINGDHAGCVVAINMGDVKTGRSVWRCPCSEPGHPATRCTNCKRIDVPTNEFSQCADTEDCKAYRSSQYAADQAMRTLDDITATLAAGRPVPETNGRTRTAAPARPSEGECLCCGGTTRGGKFLPGHDARFVSLQAAAYLKASHGREIYDTMEALGPALHAKFVKRVEKLRTEAAK